VGATMLEIEIVSARVKCPHRWSFSPRALAFSYHVCFDFYIVALNASHSREFYGAVETLL